MSCRIFSKCIGARSIGFSGNVNYRGFVLVVIGASTSKKSNDGSVAKRTAEAKPKPRIQAPNKELDRHTKALNGPRDGL